MIREPGMRVASKVSSHCSGDHHVPKTRIDPNTSNGGATYLSMVGWHYFKDIYADEFLRVGRFSRRLALTSNKSKHTFHTNTFSKAFKANFSNTLAYESN